ncbi:Lipoprotein signal peptidase [hydrothermal vent metagenome]|uniref:Lipoprotein signal peptidase n=1 Tax=hydrothermal vent metagenome TaxID=652676 RepID=A0A3B1E5N4_9ZZZZ
MSYKNIAFFSFLLIFTISIDQYIKYIFVDGFVRHFDCISFILTYNDGIAFSMLSSFGENLKYVQIALISVLFVYFIYDKVFFKNNFIALGFIMGGGISNIMDRFLHSEGVVDFVYWHCIFDFAIFNSADVFINIGAFLIILSFVLEYKNSKKEENVQ